MTKQRLSWLQAQLVYEDDHFIDKYHEFFFITCAFLSKSFRRHLNPKSSRYRIERRGLIPSSTPLKEGGSGGAKD